MKIIYNYIFYIVLLLALFACDKDEIPVLTGDIKGSVALLDAYGYPKQDNSGVRLQFSGNDYFEEIITKADGRYSFKDMPYGTYQINLIKDNYIESILDFRLNHIGGNAPTITNQIMNQIPEYSFAIDSLALYGYHQLNIYLHGIDINKPFNNTRYLHFYFSDSPAVSAENFNHSYIQLLYNKRGSYEYTINWIWWESHSGYFIYDYSDTIYCRVYPQMYYEELWSIYPSGTNNAVPESLGKPSDVFAFTLDDIQREF